mgnify:CR=1 FL=1
MARLRHGRAPRGRHLLGLVTRAADSALVVQGGGVRAVEASPVQTVVDTTGAGDLFAAGFLHGQAQGKSLEASLTLGAICAAEVIQHFGARPIVDLKAITAGV